MADQSGTMAQLRDNWHAPALIAVAVSFICFNLLNNLLFSRLRVDLTEHGLYTLSAGSRSLIEEIDSPVYFYFYFSERAARASPGLHNYARRVRELLEEYDSIGGEQLRLRIIDPEPFSEEEEQAASYGIQGLKVPEVNASVYFGLAMVDSVDRQVIMPRFELSGEHLLEYELSRHLDQLLHPHKPVLDLLSAQPLQRESGKEWAVVQQLRNKFKVRIHSEGLVDNLPADSDLLIVAHPGGLSEQSLYFIDQYAVRGGKLLVFADPVNELSQIAGITDEVESLMATRRILNAWGIVFNEQQVVAEPAWALSIQTSQGSPQRHPAYFSVPVAGMSQQDVITAELDSLNMGTAGGLSWSEEDSSGTTHRDELITTSAEARLVELRVLAAHHADGKRFYDEVRSLPAGVQRLAVRVGGSVNSAFDAPPASVSSAVEHISHAPEGVVSERIVVSDSDLLADRFWVRERRLLGHSFMTPIAANGSFVLNAVDHLSGSAALISVRSRGRFSRPFLVVEALRKRADEQHRDQAELLETRLRETERKLADIQRQAQEGESRIGINKQRRQTLRGFQQERLQLRRELRKVRHQLDQDIERLGTSLKLINIVLAPILMVLLMWGGWQLYNWWHRRTWRAE